MASKPTKDTFNVDQLLGALAQTDRDEQAEHDAAIAAARKTYVAALRRAASGKATEADAADLRASMAALNIKADELRRDSEIVLQAMALEVEAEKLPDIEAQHAAGKIALDARIAKLKAEDQKVRRDFVALVYERDRVLRAVHQLEALRVRRPEVFE